MSELHNMRLRDGVDDSIIQTVNSSKEALTHDTDTLAQLVLILAKFTDKLQMTRVTDGTETLAINSSLEAMIHDTDGLAKLTSILAKNTEILAKFTDKLQMSRITDGTEELAINTSLEATVHDADMLTQQTSSNTKLDTANTNLNAIEANQTDKTQFTQLTDSTTDVDVTLQNELKVFSYEYMIEVQKGNVPGASIVHKFGRNAAVPNGTFEGVNQLSAAFNFLTAATTVRIKSGGNAADATAGAGAQVITIEGLDNTGAFASENLATNGASASGNTTTSFWRVFRVYIGDGAAGTYGGANVGDIVLENSGGGTDLIMIATGEGQSQYGAYAIPTGKTGYLMGVKVQADASKAADFKLCVRNDLTDVTTPYSPRRIKFYWDGVLGSDNLMGNSPLLMIQPLSDIWMEAQGGGAITEVSVDFEILLIDD